MNSILSVPTTTDDSTTVNKLILVSWYVEMEMVYGDGGVGMFGCSATAFSNNNHNNQLKLFCVYRGCIE